MKKTLKNILFAGLLGLTSCSDDSIKPEPNPNPIEENLPPTANGEVNKNHGQIGETFTFNANGSTDPENQTMTYRVDVDGNGTYDTPEAAVGKSIDHVYTQGSNNNPVIQVKDEKGLESTYKIGKVGILDPENNPINIELQVPKYIIAGQEFGANVISSDENERDLENVINYGNGDIEGNTQKHTFAQSDVGTKTLEAIATNDYNISNNTTKEVEVGVEIPYSAILTDKADGQKYKIAVLENGTAWTVNNFAGKVGEAAYYKGDSLNNSVFGKYYSAEEIDDIGEVTLVNSKGIEYTYIVATSKDWESVVKRYDGNWDNRSTGELKYKSFANGENVGAEEDSRMSLMLGGARGPPGVDWTELGDKGYYITSTDNDNESKIAYAINKDNTNISILTQFPNNARAQFRLIRKDHSITD